MKLFMDSSAFAKRYIEEAGSDKVDAVCARASELGLSVICMPEIISALNRRIRERLFTQALYARVKRRLLHDVFDADVINLTPAVVGSAIRILEESPVRAMDALHIASALEWGAELFASADAQQLRAARRGGLDTIGV